MHSSAESQVASNELAVESYRQAKFSVLGDDAIHSVANSRKEILQWLCTCTEGISSRLSVRSGTSSPTRQLLLRDF